MPTTQTTEKAEAHTAEQSAKHTPGPWELVRSSDQRRDGFIRCSRKLNGAPHGLAVGQAFKHGFQYEEYNANARLIAAAPELLEALKYANRFLRKQDVDKAFIEAAIAKAEKGAQ